MAFDIEETGEWTRTATVTVPQEEFEKRITAQLRELRKEVDLDGFRKGQVPMDVMRQRYGQSVTREAVEELVNDKVNELIQDLGNVLYLDQPQITGTPGPDSETLSFTVDLELRPDLDPVGYLGMAVDKPKVEVSDEALEQEMEALRRQHAEMKPVALRETIATGDFVTLDFEALSDHPELEDMAGDDVQIEVGAGQALPGIESALEGQDLNATVESDIELGENFPVEELRGEEVPIRLNVKKVEQQVLPQVDDDFAAQTGQGETLLELRSNMRERIAEQRDEQASQEAIKNLLGTLKEQNEFSLPPKFVDQQVEKAAERQLQMLQQQGLNPADLGLDVEDLKDDMRDQVTEQIKDEFLLMEIAQKEKIEVNEEDLRGHFQQQADQMGVPLQQFMGFVQQQPDVVQQAQAQVLLDKTKDRLLSEAEINEVEWPTPEQDEQEEVDGEEDDQLESPRLEQDEQEEVDGEEDDQ